MLARHHHHQSNPEFDGPALSALALSGSLLLEALPEELLASDEESDLRSFRWKKNCDIFFRFGFNWNFKFELQLASALSVLWP